jgi:hypothetical protein
VPAPRKGLARRGLRALTTIALALSLLVATGCGSDDESAETAPPETAGTTEATTGTSDTSPPAATTTASPAPPPASAARGAVAERLAASGFRLVPQAIPTGTRAVRSSFAVPTGPVVVYILDFAAAGPARAHRRSLEEHVQSSRGGLLARRRGQTVFVGTATDEAGRSQLESRLDRVVEIGTTPLPSAPASAATTAPKAAPPAAAPPRTDQQRLAAAGFQVVKQPPPADARGARSSFTAPSGPVVVHGVAFATADSAAAYERTVAARARQSEGGLLARRVGTTVYYATATDARGRRELETQLARVVAAAEG